MRSQVGTNTTGVAETNDMPPRGTLLTESAIRARLIVGRYALNKASVSPKEEALRQPYPLKMHKAPLEMTSLLSLLKYKTGFPWSLHLVAFKIPIEVIPSRKPPGFAYSVKHVGR